MKKISKRCINTQFAKANLLQKFEGDDVKQKIGLYPKALNFHTVMVGDQGYLRATYVHAVWQD